MCEDGWFGYVLGFGCWVGKGLRVWKGGWVVDKFLGLGGLVVVWCGFSLLR